MIMSKKELALIGFMFTTELDKAGFSSKEKDVITKANIKSIGMVNSLSEEEKDDVMGQLCEMLGMPAGNFEPDNRAEA